jgi:hypothetical protein
MKQKCASESNEQIALMDWAKVEAKKTPALSLLYHVPNGGKRHVSVAIKLKKEGVKAGVPDLCLPVPMGCYHGLYIELKALDGRLTGEQGKWLDALTEQGYFATVAFGAIDAKNIIVAYLALANNAPMASQTTRGT